LQRQFNEKPPIWRLTVKSPSIFRLGVESENCQMTSFIDQQKKGRASLLFMVGRFSRFVAIRGTIRTQILTACLAISMITAALGGYATLGIRHAGDLVVKTFDESLMSINYARAAAADFSAMRAAFSRRLVTDDPAVRQNLDKEIDSLAKALAEDLSIAAERSQSPRAAAAASKVQEAANAWRALHYRGTQAFDKDRTAAGGGYAFLSEVDQYSKSVDQQVDLLINYTAGDGFLFRQRALSAIDRDMRLNIFGLAFALLLSGLISWLLARRIIKPVAVASAAARSIAEGNLNASIPEGGGDELGTLLTAMGVMRNNIKTMVEREVAQRRSAQARLADALESSREGIIVIGADGQIALANSRASEFLRVSPGLLQSNPRTELVSIPDFVPPVATSPTLDSTRDTDLASEVQLPDGRWLRVGRSVTQEGGVVVVCSDISTLKEQRFALHATNLRLDAALENMSQGLCLYDHEGRLQVVNRRFCEIFGIPHGQIRPGMSFSDILALGVAVGNHGDQTVADLLEEREALLTQPGAGGYYFQNLSGGQVVSIGHRSTSDGGWLATYEDVTEQRRAESKIAFMARHDYLTQLPNRSVLSERIEQALAQTGRGPGFAIFCLDLDYFKQVNDTSGHPVGDELLRAVANRLRGCVREIDTVVRLGGDEFAIIQPGITNPEDAALLARRLVECVGAPYEFDGKRLIIGCSVGIAMAPSDGTIAEKLLKNADVALYRAKSDGRGTWRFFEPEMDASLQARRALELDLREAMDKDEFELFYQLFYCLRSDRVSGFEALLRWRHPTRGLVPPELFIPIAEEIGLIIPLGEWVLCRACEQAATWPEELKLAVNVSAVQFRNSELIEVVAKALAASKLPAHRLELEITESVLLANSAETLAKLHKLHALGLSIALDDFGTGYSSLSYLRSFPFEKLKIDQSFVRDLTGTEESKVIVRAIVSLGRSLGMQTTAEGVETIEQLNQVRAEGCDEAQGFFFSHPVPATELASAIMTWRNGLTQSHVKSFGRLNR
jgi:diguanylate cyclase (GGDEF)-like protein